MLAGILSGVLWALDTVILGVALSATEFATTEQAVFLAPFISAFLHDAFSSIGMFIYMAVKKQLRSVIKALKTKGGKFIALAALLAGPVGMLGYVMAIRYIGPGYTAIISSAFPALGALFSYIFLKEKMSTVQIIGLLLSIAGIIVIGYSPGSSVITNFTLGIIFASVCCIGWASEAVILAYGLKNSEITDEQALQIRQTVSALFYGAVIINVVRGWGFVFNNFFLPSTGIILLSAVFGTLSYLLYYRAIAHIGASKSMALNITYVAWSVLFSLILLKTIPDLKTVICGIVIILGSLVAAGSIPVKRKV